MSDAMIRDLAWMEYDVVAIDARLGELRDKLRRAAGQLPLCASAAGEVRLMQVRLRRLLTRLDADITAAVRSHEHRPV
jgi:hypothetical protein